MTTTEQPVKTESTEKPVTTAEAVAPKDSILTKAPTFLHRRYAQYIVEKFGLEVPGAEMPASFFDEGNPEWEHFVKVVQISVTRYGEFQKSSENAESKALEAARREKQADEAKAEKDRIAKEKAEAKAQAEAAKPAKGEAKSEGGDEAKTRKPASGKAASSKVEAPF